MRRVVAPSLARFRHGIHPTGLEVFGLAPFRSFRSDPAASTVDWSGDADEPKNKLGGPTRFQMTSGS
jgi:hypothetical protein